jgi:ParB/RepB/Spo0J family partition protein
MVLNNEPHFRRGKMKQIENISTSLIDPESTVNVRLSMKEEGVDRVKDSIAEHGFLDNYPITIRPHPDQTSEYKYEIVMGKCRLHACLELGFDQIPAIVELLSDSDAIRLSWSENEGRSDITPSDKAHWIKKIMTENYQDGKTLTQSREIAAKFFTISVPTVIKYYPMAFLPQKVMDMVDKGELRIEDASVIAKNTVGSAKQEDAEQIMTNQAEWISNLDKPHRDEAAKVIKDSDPSTPIDELDKIVEERILEKKKTITFEIAEASYMRIIEWGMQQGLPDTDPSTIINHMIIVTLRGT